MGFKLKGRFVFFATDNFNKFDEARGVLSEHKIGIGMLRVKGLEIQSHSLEEIAEASVLDAYKRSNLPLIVEDAGLFVEALNGFPGPYAAYVYETIGNKGLLKLMRRLENRKAAFRSVIAFHSAELESPVCFKGKATGEIATVERRGNHQTGFGFDPIFIPAQSNKTFAEMTVQEKNKYSHRAEALGEFVQWYTRT